MKPHRHLMTPPLHARVYGDGERTAVLLHGFPDDPDTFAPLLAPLVNDGWRLVVPWMRGYGLSGPAPDERYDLTTLSGDVVRLLDAVDTEKGIVIGHDWGAATAYLAAVQHPQRIRGIATLSVPPPSTLLSRTWRHPSQLHRSRYMAQMQSPRFVERTLIPREAPLIETLWRRWSPQWNIPPERLESVRNTLAHRKCAEAAAQYYHHLLPRGPQTIREWRKTLRDAMRPIPCPGLLMTGENDGCMDPALFREASHAFHGECEIHVLREVGHFLHQEDPEGVLELLRPWMKAQGKALDA